MRFETVIWRNAVNSTEREREFTLHGGATVICSLHSPPYILIFHAATLIFNWVFYSCHLANRRWQNRTATQHTLQITKWSRGRRERKKKKHNINRSVARAEILERSFCPVAVPHTHTKFMCVTPHSSATRDALALSLSLEYLCKQNKRATQNRNKKRRKTFPFCTNALLSAPNVVGDCMLVTMARHEEGWWMYVKEFIR